MFQEFLKKHTLRETDLSTPMFPSVSERKVWEDKENDIFIKAAESLLGYSWPTITATDYMAFSRTGDRVIMENKHFERRYALSTLVTAEICEHKGRFTDEIINGLMTTCEESYWGLSAHYLNEVKMIPDAIHPYIDLFAAETAAALAVTLNMLEAELSAVTPDIVRRVRYELDRRIVEPFLTREDPWWMGYHKKDLNNWTPWIASNIVTVALLEARDKTARCELIEKALLITDRFLACVPDDGGCDEGASYWNVSALSVFDTLYQLYLASGGKLDFFGEPLVKRMGDYLCRVYIGDGFVANFSDCPGRIDRPGFGTGMVYLFGKMTENKQLMGLGYELSGQTLGRQVNLRRRLLSIIYPAEKCDFVPERHMLLDRLEIATYRTSCFNAVIRGGHNADGHNHNDVGSFVVFGGTTPILIDTGCGVYTKKTFSPERYSIWTMQSAWHNLPVVNGVMQMDGAEYHAENFVSTPEYTSMDIAKAYPDTSGLESLVRMLSVGDDEIILTDTYVFKTDDNTVTENFMMRDEPMIEASAVKIGKYVMTLPEGFCAEKDAKPISDDRSLYGTWGADDLWRLRVTGKVGNGESLTFTLKRSLIS